MIGQWCGGTGTRRDSQHEEGFEVAEVPVGVRQGATPVSLKPTIPTSL